MRMNNFQEVINRYEAIKPLGGPLRKGRDVRPLGNRRYWWNRIYKHSDSYYALNCGSAGWNVNATPSWDGYTEEEKAQGLKNMLTKSPIVWERKADGDYIRINRGCGYSVSTYKFLWMYLPKGLNYSYRNGKHRITCNGEYHAMPSGRYSDEGLPTLEFKYIEDGKWERTNDKFLLKTQRVDKEKAKMLKPHIKKLWEWMNIVMPIFGKELNAHTDEAFRNLRRVANVDYFRDLKEAGAPEIVLDILTNETHENRMDFALSLVNQIGACQSEFVRTSETNRWEGHTYYWFAPSETSYARLRKTIYEMTDSYRYEYL